MGVILLFSTGILTIIFGLSYLKSKSVLTAKFLFIYSLFSLILFLIIFFYNFNLYKEEIAQAISNIKSEENKEKIKEEQAGIVVPEQTAREIEVSKKLLDAPLISQLPELPRGCEVTSLAMFLGDAGVRVDKMELAKEVRKDPTPMTYQNGKIHFGNPNIGFVGDMYTFKNPGYGVYNKPIFHLAERYLPGKIVNMTGESFDSVLNKIKADKTVWIISNVTFDVLEDSQFETWDTPEGPIRMTYKEHSVLVTGFDEKYIYFNDPLTNIKNSKADKKKFIAAWEQMGKQAISLK
ncbi:C39 family peptidase [Domibacillus robiginosus]|uniref:C39 family peptidase n=1 Tax=Domibacillus robiginosus TaxID=1071054 RepID=UPI0009E1EAB6